MIIYQCAQCRHALSHVLTLCGLSDSFVYGILQARILEWVAMPYSRGSFHPWDWTYISCISCVGRWILYHLSHLGNSTNEMSIKAAIKIIINIENLLSMERIRLRYDFNIIHSFIKHILSTYFVIGHRDVRIDKTVPSLRRWAIVAQKVKNLLAMQDTLVQSLGQEDPLEKGMAIHSNILAWRIPWTEEPGGLQPMGSQRTGYDCVPKTLRSLL